jgi:YfiH family protein
MILKSSSDMRWLEFELLQRFPMVSHGVFLKPTYVKEEFTSLPIDREKVRQALSIPSLISSHQVHGDIVKDVDDLSSCDQCDGIFTQKREVGLLIKHADCQAAIFYDPIKEVIANVHSGWRGSVANIYAKVVRALEKKVGSSPQDLIVCISPSLGPSHAEFKNFLMDFPKEFASFQIRPNYFDFWALSKWQLMNLGIQEKNIEIASLCTYEREGEFYSYRRDKTTERNVTVVALKKREGAC